MLPRRRGHGRPRRATPTIVLTNLHSNSLLLSWIGLLVWLRAREKRKSDWTWFPAVLLAAGALNWFAPFFFSLGIVYLHPLVALWFLDRHLVRTRPQWVRAYRSFLLVLPMILTFMIWRMSQAPPLVDDNGLFWRITQHSGAELLPAVSSHMLVSVHSYPIVVLVVPLLLADYSRATYLLVAETFAPVTECALFWLAFGSRSEVRSSMWRDFVAIVLANLASFGAGELLNRWEWFGLI
jgi:hypothetical protein